MAYIFYIPVLAPERAYLLFLGDIGSQGECRLFRISYIYKCYLTTRLCFDSEEMRLGLHGCTILD